MHPNSYSLCKLAGVMDTSQLAALSDRELQAQVARNELNKKILEDIGGVPGTGSLVFKTLASGAIGAGSGYLLGRALNRIMPDINIRPGYLSAFLGGSGLIHGAADAWKDRTSDIRDLIVLNQLKLDRDTGLLTR